MNLISNTVKLTKRDRVSLTVGWHSDERMFKIEDTGAGIPDDLQHRIFDDFVTGNAAYDREVGETDLGLSIAKWFIHLLSGAIAVASELGVGSTFRVVVPAKVAISPVKSHRQIEGTSVVTHLRVLVVEENEINKVVEHEMLKANGQDVKEAHDGKQGVDMAAVEKFDLILMDIGRPVLDGRRTTCQIRQGKGASLRARIVAPTANAIPSEQDDFLKHGMDDILTNPLKKSDLLTALGTPEHAPLPRDYVLGGPCPYDRNL